MVVRDVSSRSIRGMVALFVVCASVSCDRDTEPAPKPRKRVPTAVGAGGVSGLPRQVAAQPSGTAGSSNAGAPNLPLGSRYAASLGNINGFSAATGKFVKVPYVGELYDEQDQFDEKKNRFKAAAAQAYHVCASLSSLDKDFELSLYVNGARENVLAYSHTGIAQGCRTVRLKKADLLEVWVRQATGAAMQFSPNEFSNWMTVDPLKEGASLDSIDAFTAKPGEFKPVPFASERYDVDNQFDAKTKRFAAAVTGDYRVCTALSSSSDDFELDLAINGNRENGFAISKQGAATGCRTTRLTEGQYVEVFVHHESAKGPMSFVPTKFANWLTVDKVPASDLSMDVSLDNTSAFNVPSGTPAKVPYVNKLYDDGNLFNLQASRFMAPAPHDYRICASLASLSKDFEIDLYVNGAREKAIATSGHGIGAGCRTVRLKKAGDFVEVWAIQASGAPLPFESNQFWNWMTVEPAHLF